MKNTLFTCITCKNIFRNRSELNYHVKRNHQSNVKVIFQNGDVSEIERAEDGMFKCKCGKSFQYPDSLRRHAKNCNDRLAEIEEEREVESMNVDDSDASEPIDVDDRVMPIDCIGTRISHEKADCR